MIKGKDYTDVEALIHIVSENRTLPMRGYIPGIAPEFVHLVMKNKDVEKLFFMPDGMDAGSAQDKIEIGRKYILVKILSIL